MGKGEEIEIVSYELLPEAPLDTRRRTWCGEGVMTIDTAPL